MCLVVQASVFTSTGSEHRGPFTIPNLNSAGVNLFVEINVEVLIPTSSPRVFKYRPLLAIKKSQRINSRTLLSRFPTEKALGYVFKS